MGILHTARISNIETILWSERGGKTVNVKLGCQIMKEMKDVKSICHEQGTKKPESLGGMLKYDNK